MNLGRRKKQNKQQQQQKNKTKQNKQKQHSIHDVKILTGYLHIGQVANKLCDVRGGICMFKPPVGNRRWMAEGPAVQRDGVHIKAGLVGIPAGHLTVNRQTLSAAQPYFNPPPPLKSL